jgi:hypothetical protein
MANKFKGEVDFEAQGKNWVLRLGMNDLIELQEKLGIEEDDLAKFFFQLARSMGRSMKKTRTAITVALKGNQPETTEETAGEIITELGFKRTGDLLAEAIKWAMPDPPEGGEKDKGKGRSPGASTSTTQPALD